MWLEPINNTIQIQNQFVTRRSVQAKKKQNWRHDMHFIILNSCHKAV